MYKKADKTRLSDKILRKWRNLSESPPFNFPIHRFIFIDTIKQPSKNSGKRISTVSRKTTGDYFRWPMVDVIHTVCMYREVPAVIKIPKKSTPISLDKRTCGALVSISPIRAVHQNSSGVKYQSEEHHWSPRRSAHRRGKRKRRDLYARCAGASGVTFSRRTDVHRRGAYANKRATADVLVTRGAGHIDMRDIRHRGRRRRQTG